MKVLVSVDKVVIGKWVLARQLFGTFRIVQPYERAFVYYRSIPFGERNLYHFYRFMLEQYNFCAF